MSRKMYDGFTNKYSVSKTLRFELIPQGRTLEYLERDGILKEDEDRAEDYKKVKKIIDDYHKTFIEKALSGVQLDGVKDYASVYLQKDHDANDLDKEAEKLRKEIVSVFKNQAEYNDLFSERLISELLPAFKQNDPETLGILKKFNRFTTYFTGFHENRKNMYSAEAKSTAIAYRVVDQNLPKYIDNYVVFKRALSYEDIADEMVKAEKELDDILQGRQIKDAFSVNEYSNYITQTGIDRYNQLIGGIAVSDRKRVQGINEIINLHNQKSKREDRVGTLKPLYKQILSERTIQSYLPESFENDQEVIDAVRNLHTDIFDSVLCLQSLLKDIGQFDLNKVFVKNDGSIAELSKEVYGNWNVILGHIQDEYDSQHTDQQKKNYEKYIDKRNKELKKRESYSIAQLEDICGDSEITTYYSGEKVEETANQIALTHQNILPVLDKPFPSSKSLIQEEEYVEGIKNYLDSLKQFQRVIKPLLGSGKESDKDAGFYGDFERRWAELDVITPFYNKIRNYMTQKPYSTEKIKINFSNSTLLNGWDLNKEADNTSVILMKDNAYFLGIMSQGNNRIFQFLEDDPHGKCYKKMEYKLIPGPNKMLPKVFFSKSRIDEFSPSAELIEKYRKGTHKKGENFNLGDCHKLIDFFKQSIERHPDWSQFDFHFSNTKEYQDISDFYREVSEQGYKLSFKEISESTIDKMVEEGKLYLFQIYNKDFSPYSKGNPNLHTLYWKMLFDEDNLKNVVYKLNGEAEVFYRKASIKPEKAIVHKKKQPIQNKNELNEKKTSVFDYDIIKDRRYTLDKFQFHVPITLNFKATGRDNINLCVREAIKQTEGTYVIGIDRGERHLLYISVIDSQGNIVEQTSLNRIISSQNKGNEVAVDYHDLLDAREKARDEARKGWKSIESIKELKEGYLSQVVYYITQLMVKYNAIVVLEDLNFGFKRGRQKVEKQVYQKFEKMLIDKLNYLVDKHTDPTVNGGLLHAYQLTGKFESFKKLGKQSGVLFYTEAWNTSKVDPVTGFVNLFDTKYKSVKESQEFWRSFDGIRYDDSRDLFEFSFRYSNFTHKGEGARDHWVLYTYGNRIRTFRNNQGVWDNEEINLTEAWKLLCDEGTIDWHRGNLINAFAEQSDKDFHKKLLSLFKLTLQMRNSITGTETDYIVSPAPDESGNFYDSRRVSADLPVDADANGAYNIARKGLMMVERIRETPDEDLRKINLAISNIEWLKRAQHIE